MKRLLGLLGSIKHRAGAPNLAILGILQIVLGFAADYLKPFFNFVTAGLIAAIISSALFSIALAVVRKPPSRPLIDRLFARGLLFSLIGCCAFSVIWITNLSLDADNGVLRELRQLNEQTSRIESKIDGVKQDSSRTASNTDALNKQQSIANAQGLIQIVTSKKDGSDIGQARAFELLVKENIPFAGVDLSGISLRRTTVSGANLAGADFTAANLSEARFSSADMRGLKARFSDISAASFASSELTDSVFIFATGAKSVFSGTNASGANFSGALLQDADFSGADLTGTVFAFADLTGANFQGAKLQDAIFIGAILTGARFDNAETKNTNIAGAAVSKSSFSPNQIGELCMLPGAAPFRIEVVIIERIPSTRFSGGMEYRREIERNGSVNSFAGQQLPKCRNGKSGNPKLPEPVETANGTITRGYFAMGVSTEILSKANRRAHFRMQIDGWLTTLGKHLTASAGFEIQ